MQSLRRLAVSDSRSLAYQDSDIFSTTERVQIWAVVDEQVDERNEELTEAGQEPAAISDGLRSFDTHQGVIRGIRYINSHFFGLHVTRDNVDALLKSENTQRESRELACFSPRLPARELAGQGGNAGCPRVQLDGEEPQGGSVAPGSKFLGRCGCRCISDA